MTTRESERNINSLKLKHSHSCDESSTKILKTSASFFISPLNYICNKSILSGIYPTQLKYPVMKPVFKKCERNNVTNYRIIITNPEPTNIKNSVI